MMQSTKGYRSYHGKGGTGRIVLIVLLCLILFAAVGFLILQRYAVYESDGSVRFELPWSKEKQPKTPQDTTTPADPEIVVEPPEDNMVAELLELHAQELSVDALKGGTDTVLAQLPEEINAVAVRMKESGGALLYASGLSAAREAGAVRADIPASAIETLTRSSRYTIARISALHDSFYAQAHPAQAAVMQIQHPGYVWYDPDSTFYLAPEKEAARQYIVSIAQECAQLGFDELLFDEFTYPPGGRLSNIDESARTMTKSEALALLSDELRAGVPENVKLSVVLDAETVLAGGNETTGQELSVLAEKFDRIYVAATEEQIPALTKALEPYPAELVPVVAAARADGSYLLSA